MQLQGRLETIEHVSDLTCNLLYLGMLGNLHM